MWAHLVYLFGSTPSGAAIVGGMDDKTISYRREDILKVIRVLNYVVVSLDRIGSRTAELPEQEQARALNKFFSPKVFEHLAESRQILHEVFSDELGPDDMDELERELKDLEYWPKRLEKLS
jgi:hypothetical protein